MSILRLNKNGKWRSCWCLVACFIFASPVFAETQRLRVGFLYPSSEGNPFWDQAVTVMRAVAEDLDIELIVRYDTVHNTFTAKHFSEFLLNEEPPLDYMLSKYWLVLTEEHLNLTKKRGTKVFIFNSDIPEADRKIVGYPRERYRNWIGHMAPDDRKAGAALADILFARARAKYPERKIQALGLTSPGISSVTFNRIDGLQDRVNADSVAVLQDVSVIGRDLNPVRESVKTRLGKYPQTDVVWAVNEALAWGAVQAAGQMDKTPGKDMFIGGFDWNPDSFEALADGRMSVVMTGHFMEGAWALILAHDYHHGIDFESDTGVRISTPLHAVDAGNIERYKNLMNPEYWDKVDFRKFSKYHNPELKSYNFDISQFLK